MEIEKLYTKYLSKKIPMYYSIDEVDQMYKEKYKAKELAKTDFIDLKEDPYVDFSNIIKCYEIYDENILDNLYSDKEKAAEKEFYEAFILNYPEEDYKKIRDNKINIILESKDGERISSFTVQGGCNYIFNEIVVFKGAGLEEQNLENRRFINYLKCLEDTGNL